MVTTRSAVTVSAVRIAQTAQVSNTVYNPNRSINSLKSLVRAYVPNSASAKSQINMARASSSGRLSGLLGTSNFSAAKGDFATRCLSPADTSKTQQPELNQMLEDWVNSGSECQIDETKARQAFADLLSDTGCCLDQKGTLVVEGNVVLFNSAISCFPTNDVRIEGHLHLHDCKNLDFSQGSDQLQITGDLRIMNCHALQSLPEVTVVNRKAQIVGCNNLNIANLWVQDGFSVIQDENRI